jgi:GNAT superfamily N-acetyltransferase
VTTSTVTLAAVRADEFEELLALRIAAMRDSLERIGRFDPERARQRLRASFAPAQTRHILLDGARAGFVTVKHAERELLLDHLYVHPRYQGRQIGALVLRMIFDEADALGLPIRVGALRESGANRFYRRHGFVQVEEGEWDIYYARPPQNRAE